MSHGKEVCGRQDLAILTDDIERKRSKLNKLGDILGALHSDVLAHSEQLDQLILQHMRAQLKGKSRPS